MVSPRTGSPPPSCVRWTLAAGTGQVTGQSARQRRGTAEAAAVAAAPTASGAQPHSQLLHLLVRQKAERHLGEPGERGSSQLGVGAGQTHPAGVVDSAAGGQGWAGGRAGRRVGGQGWAGRRAGGLAGGRQAGKLAAGGRAAARWAAGRRGGRAHLSRVPGSIPAMSCSTSPGSSHMPAASQWASKEVTDNQAGWRRRRRRRQRAAGFAGATPIHSHTHRTWRHPSESFLLLKHLRR